MAAVYREETHFLSKEFFQGLVYKQGQKGGKGTAIKKEGEQSTIMGEDEEFAIMREDKVTAIKMEGIKTAIKKMKRRKGNSCAGNHLQNQ